MYLPLSASIHQPTKKTGGKNTFPHPVLHASDCLRVLASPRLFLRLVYNENIAQESAFLKNTITIDQKNPVFTGKCCSAKGSAAAQLPIRAANRCQPPSPGAFENISILPSLPSIALASGNGSFLVIMTGQAMEYVRLNSTHFSMSGSVSGRIASAGHSGSHTPQSMHSSG